MKALKKHTHYVCGCCKRSLPATAFYMDKKTGRPGNYCKECRKSASRAHRSNEKFTLLNDSEPDRPIITRTEDPVLRQELIIQALRTVAASIERKRKKLREAEAERID